MPGCSTMSHSRESSPSWWAWSAVEIKLSCVATAAACLVSPSATPSTSPGGFAEGAPQRAVDFEHLGRVAGFRAVEGRLTGRRRLGLAER